jgi:hypothetical protein
MFLRRRTEREEGGGAAPLLGSIRDVVEIVAIVAAGAWAFYTFVYENQIKPANERAEVQIESTLTRLGQSRGLLAVQSHILIRNVGVSDVSLYGFAETVTGSTVRPGGPTPAPSVSGAATYLQSEPGWVERAKTTVYSVGLLTRIADVHASNELNLRPGQSAPFDRLIYVPAGKFDELDTFVSTRFSSNGKPLPMHLAKVDGLIRVESNAEDDSDSINERAATLSLWH